MSVMRVVVGVIDEHAAGDWRRTGAATVAQRRQIADSPVLGCLIVFRCPESPHLAVRSGDDTAGGEARTLLTCTARFEHA